MFVVSGIKSGDRGPISIENPASIEEKSNSKVMLTSQLSVSKRSEGKVLCMGSEDVLKLYDINNAKKCSPVGRLKQSLHKWEQIGASRYILNVIENGYTLPLKVCLRNNKSMRENANFVSEVINNLLQKGVVSECESQPHVVNPLTVAFNKASKPRLVLDCRHINPLLHKFKFKYEDIKTEENMFEKGTFLFTFDLREAYQNISIQEKSRAYLGFAWHDGKSTRSYVFNVLAFGIATAGHIFSKTVREMVKYW